MMNLISPVKGIRPINGIVPNAETAIKIAEAVWYPVYGDDIYSSSHLPQDIIRQRHVGML